MKFNLIKIFCNSHCNFLNYESVILLSPQCNCISYTFFSGSLMVTIVLAVALATVAVNASDKMTRNNFCNQKCNNNICRNVENNTAIPSLAGCNQFFICVMGHPIPSTCPDGQLFNTITSHCENSTNLHCEVKGFECPPDGIHFFPHEEYCDKYFICSAGYVDKHFYVSQCALINYFSFPVLFHCADGLYFDRELETCNFPEYAECPLEVCPRTNDPDNIVFLPSDAYCDK